MAIPGLPCPLASVSPPFLQKSRDQRAASLDVRAEIYFRCKSTEPSITVGVPAPVLDAFFAIHSLATSRLWSVPALSSQIVTDAPPSAVNE